MGANAVTTVPVYTAGEVLTAADLNITNSGIPVFASTVERDAAFGGSGEKVLAEGQFAYIEATNTTQYYDGAAWQSVGLSGLVPIVPTSVAVTGAGSSATVNAAGQVTFTSCATLLLNGVFTSAYRNYRIIFEGTNTTTVAVAMRLSTGGTPNTTSNYNHERVVFNGTAVAAARVSSATSFTEFFNNVNSTQGDNNSIDIFNPQVTANTGFNTLGYSTAVGGYLQIIGGHFAATTSFDGIQLIPASGASSGTISVYGYTI